MKHALSKNSLLSLLIAVLFCAGSLPATAGAEEFLTIRALRADRTPDADKIFNTAAPDTVFRLKKLSPAQYAEALRLPDVDRKRLAEKKRLRPEEYHYTLESAAAQSSKETEKAHKDASGGTEGAAETDGKEASPGDSSFFATVSPAGRIEFIFRHSNRENGVYEVLLEPLRDGRSGRQILHFLADPATGRMTLLSRHSNAPSRTGIRVHSRLTDRQERITTVAIPDGAILDLFGEVPFSGGLPSLWRIAVFRWAEGSGASLAGMPGAAPDSCLVIPSFTPKAVREWKIRALDSALKSFFTVQREAKASRMDQYLNGLIGNCKAFGFWKKMYRIPVRLGSAGWFSDMYLARLPRSSPEELSADLETTSGKEDGPGQRIREYQKDITELGVKIRKSFENPLLLDSAMRCFWERFRDWEYERDRLRLEAIRDRTFSKKFLEDLL